MAAETGVLIELRPGTTLDGFVLGEKVHEGGMAALFRVERPGDARELLLKAPRLAFGSHPAGYVGLEVEQMILGRLAGPHVPALVASGSVQAAPWYVMERIAGPSLRELSKDAPLPSAEVARLGAAVARALHSLHRQHVVHMDVKPANVLFRPGGEAVLVDFGIARHAHLPDLIEEAFHEPLGTGAYISPEQVLGVRGDPRSDLYSLGVILYQLATARLPFGAPDQVRGTRRRLYAEAVPPRAIDPGVPDWLQEIILRCLEPDPANRYASAAQLAHDLSHPDQVPVGERGRRLKAAGPLTVLRRWAASLGRASHAVAAPSAQSEQAPLVLVALDAVQLTEDLADALRATVRRIAAADPRCRVLCVSVLEPSILSEGESGREVANTLLTERMAFLRHWVQPLALEPERVRYHVLESTDPASALVGYADSVHADQIVMGARASSALRRFLGSVSARVVSEAGCTVTVVRPTTVRDPGSG